MEDNKSAVNAKLLLTALFTGYTLVYIDKLSISFSAVPISRELSINPEQVGGLMSAFFFGYAIMQVPMGFVIRKLGSRAVALFSVAGIGIFTLFFSFGTSLSYLIAIRFFTGFIAHSGYASSASTQITHNIPLEKRTFAQGAVMASSGFATIAGPILISKIITFTGDWRWAYRSITGIALLIAVFMVFSIPKSSRTVLSSAADKIDKPKISIKKIWGSRLLWTVFVSCFFLNALLYGSSNWVPSFLIKSRSFTIDEAGYLTAVSGVFILLGAFGGSFLVNKYMSGKEKYAVAFTVFLGSLSIFTAYYMGSFATIALMMGIANCLFIVSFISLMSIVLKRFAGADFSVKYATIATGGIMGGALSPIFIGYLIKNYGSYYTTFVYFLILGVITACSVLFIKGKIPAAPESAR